MRDGIHQAVQLISEFGPAVVFTGAGLSTRSGIPDFRSAGSGLWTRDDPMRTASLSTFRHDPRRFWNWKALLMTKIWDSQPNDAHLALVSMQRKGHLSAILTQNIDGLHQRAGSSPVHELHGSITHLSCPRCRRRWDSRTWESVIRAMQLPLCPEDGTVLKPGVVLFEEMLPADVWKEAERLSRSAGLFLVAGSSLVVFPAAGLPQTAINHGARLIIINRDPTPLDEEAQLTLQGDVAEILPLIAEQLPPVRG